MRVSPMRPKGGDDSLQQWLVIAVWLTYKAVCLYAGLWIWFANQIFIFLFGVSSSTGDMDVAKISKNLLKSVSTGQVSADSSGLQT